MESSKSISRVRGDEVLRMVADWGEEEMICSLLGSAVLCRQIGADTQILATGSVGMITRVTGEHRHRE